MMEQCSGFAKTGELNGFTLNAKDIRSGSQILKFSKTFEVLAALQALNLINSTPIPQPMVVDHDS